MPVARIDELTQEELVAALVAGASLSLPDGSSWVPLDERLRRILRGVWPDRIRARDNNASADEACDILAAVETNDALPPWRQTRAATTATVWTLLNVAISHFGGVTGPLTADTVELAVPESGLLIYGRNGSGKSSLARAIIWALTGRVIDSDGADKPAGDVTSEYKSDDGASTVSLPTIVPFPTREQLQDPTKIQLPQVTLKFTAADGRILLVERALARPGKSGKPFSHTCRVALLSDDGQPLKWSSVDGQPLKWSSVEDIATALGVPHQAMENAALQVARLERLNPSAGRNPLAVGIEQLSGLTRLGEVCDRMADKLSGYLSGGYANGLQKDADVQSEGVAQALEGTSTALDETRLGPLPDGDTSTPETCKQYLDEIEAFLAPKRAGADRALSEVLELADGASPPADAQAELVRARDTMSGFASEDPLETLLTTWATAEKSMVLRTKVTEIKERINRYEVLQRDRARKVRSTLYSRIEKWAEDEGLPDLDWSNCPVCETDLVDRRDPLFDEPIRQAVVQARRDAQLLREDAQRLDRGWSEELAGLWAGCPGVDDLELLMRAPALLGIEPLRGRTDLLGLVAKKVLSESPEKAAEGVTSPTGNFARTHAALATAIGLVDCLDALASAASDILSERSRVIAEINSLLQRVDDALRSHRPIRTALSELAKARKALDAWAPIQVRIANAKSIGPKLTDLRRVRKAIDAVVAHTLGTLKKRAINEYYFTLYRAPWLGQPEVRDVAAAPNAKLDILATIDDVSGDGARLLNHSHLRAVLLAFAGALKESADRRGGGLDLMVLDDPHTLVDEINRDGLGGWLKALRGAKSRPIVFTHSDAFASVVGAKLETPRMRVRPLSGMRDHGRLLLVGGTNEIKELSDQLPVSTDEAIYAKLCAAIRVELEDKLRVYCDTLCLKMEVDRPTLYHYRIALITARSQPAFKDRLSTGPFDDLLKDRYVTLADEIARRVMDALNEAHHAPKDNVTQQDAWQAKAAWEHLLPLLSACDRIAFDALNAPRVLPQRLHEPILFAVPAVPVTTAVAALLETRPEDGGNWHPLDLGECHAVRVRRNFDWLPGYVRGGDVLLVSPTWPRGKSCRLLYARHFKPAPNNSVVTTLGFSGNADGRLTAWGVGGKGTIVEPPYEVEAVRAILFAPPEASGDARFAPLLPEDINLSEFRAAPIIGESAEPFATLGDQVLIREAERIEMGQPLVDRRIYVVETADGTSAVKRFDRRASGTADCLVFQPIGLSLGGDGTTIIARSANKRDDIVSDDTIARLWPVRGFLFSA